MDIKNALNAMIPFSLRTAKVDKTLKSGTTTDRDANGQQQQGSQQKKQEPMTAEQIDKAVAHLMALPIVLERGLLVTVEGTEGRRFVVLTEPDGKVVRKIGEAELWTLQDVKETEKGQLLSKTA